MIAGLKELEGGTVASTPGFLAAGISSGIKSGNKKDLALVASDVDCEVGATFTTNQIKAAPVRLSAQHSKRGTCRAVIINSGCANACTGIKGITDAKSMAETTASELKTTKSKILVCSTGGIGHLLPMDKVTSGIRKAAHSLKEKYGTLAAKAIMTTDTFHKEHAVSFLIDGKRVTIGAMAKGAGMIHPNMATMLCVVTTDAHIDKVTLQKCTHNAVEETFNRISVDGDTSTNDSVLVLANGLAKNNKLRKGHAQVNRFQQALTQVMQVLARMIIEDGEGITKVVELHVKGANSTSDAKKHAEAIACSPLVKCAWAGHDPNWGRIVAAMGYSGARIREELIDIYYDGVAATKGGLVTKTPLSKLRKIARKRNYTITIDLNIGKGQYNLLTNDFTEEYVKINRAYE
ncbi:MAG: bifunctional glutamate N-acetyltransferase/amino-acid acetyltransferase ArgJ [Verrucomicrobiota bacterium]